MSEIKKKKQQEEEENKENRNGEQILSVISVVTSHRL